MGEVVAFLASIALSKNLFSSNKSQSSDNTRDGANPNAPPTTLESKLRYDLSVAHCMCHKYGMDELVWNHISARIDDGWLITPGLMHWDEVSPESLVKVRTLDLEGASELVLSKSRGPFPNEHLTVIISNILTPFNPRSPPPLEVLRQLHCRHNPLRNLLRLARMLRNNPPPHPLCRRGRLPTPRLCRPNPGW